MSIASSSPASLITLQSSDGATFQVEASVALHSETIKAAVEENAASPVRLSDVGGDDLAVIACYFHDVCAGKRSADDFVKEFSADKERLFGVLRAADSLKITSLLDLLCQTVADIIKGKTPAEIASFLNLEMSITPRAVMHSKGEDIRLFFCQDMEPLVEQERERLWQESKRLRQERDPLREEKEKLKGGPADGEDEWSYRERVRQFNILAGRMWRERIRDRGAVFQIPRPENSKTMPVVSSPPGSSSVTKGLIALKSSDGLILMMEESATLHSEVMKATIAENPNPKLIPQLQGVDGQAFGWVSLYLHEVCMRNGSADQYVESLTITDNKKRLFNVMMAAKSLKIQPLFDLLRPIVADMMAGKTPEEMRRLFDFDFDYTDDELEELKEQMGCFSLDPEPEAVLMEQESDRVLKRPNDSANGEDEWIREKKLQLTGYCQEDENKKQSTSPNSPI